VATCECARCGEKFSGLRPFDAHQDVDYKRPHGDVVRCMAPASVGLVLDPVMGRWGSTDGSAYRAQRANAAATASRRLAGAGSPEPASRQ
jgi:hypothetical protein